MTRKPSSCHPRLRRRSRRITEARGREGARTSRALEKLVGLYERVEDRRAATEFTAAMLAFQSVCPVVVHNRQASFATKAGGKFSYSFADLAEICRTVNPVLHPLGLSYTWDSRVSDNGALIRVTCTLTHTAGHSVQASFEAPVEEGAGTSAAQDYAKILTFGERKSLGPGTRNLHRGRRHGRGAGGQDHVCPVHRA